MQRRLPVFAALALALAAAAPTAAAQTFAITNAHLVTPGPVGEVENGTVIVRDGRIAAAGAAIVVPSGMRIVDARGATVTPGFVAVNTALGLVEVNSVGGSVDNRTHNSGISASFDVQYGLNPDSTLIPIARLGGVTHAVVMPDYDDSDTERELPFAGKAALISLGEGANILHRPGVGMMLELGEDGAARVGGSRAAEFVQLRQIFDLARQPPTVGAHPAAVERHGFGRTRVRRAAHGSERKFGLGRHRRRDLLGHHALGFGGRPCPAAGQLHHAQRHHLAGLGPEPEGVDRQLQPGIGIEHRRAFGDLSARA